MSKQASNTTTTIPTVPRLAGLVAKAASLALLLSTAVVFTV